MEDAQQQRGADVRADVRHARLTTEIQNYGAFGWGDNYAYPITVTFCGTLVDDGMGVFSTRMVFLHKCSPSNALPL